MTHAALAVPAPSSKWGTPDPRDEGRLLSPKRLNTPAEWAWQFLRRNHEYHEHWQDHARFGLWMPLNPSIERHEAPPFIAQITPMIGVSALLKRVGLDGVPEPQRRQLGENQVAVVYDLGRGLDNSWPSCLPD